MPNCSPLMHMTRDTGSSSRADPRAEPAPARGPGDTPSSHGLRRTYKAAELNGMDRQALRDEKIASAILDVCFQPSGNIDVLDLAGQVLVRLGFK